MSDQPYIYRKTVKGRRYSKFRRRLIITIIFLLLVIGIILFFLLDRGEPTQSAKSGIENIVISDNLYTTTSPFFKFQDTSKWVFDSRHSTANKLVYGKFNKLDPIGVLIVYVNTVPIPLDLATPRVLPVRIVNGNSFDITQVSDPCGKTYGTELHKEKIVSIDYAQMLCDPDSPQYFLQLSEISGDYRLHLHRSDGSPIQFVITYHDVTVDPNPRTILQVAKTFQAL